LTFELQDFDFVEMSFDSTMSRFSFYGILLDLAGMLPARAPISLPGVDAEEQEGAWTVPL
jgi:hypothetical protein